MCSEPHIPRQRGSCLTSNVGQNNTKMPVGEIIAEIGLRLVVEILFYGIGYWIGFCVLKICTLGMITLAPFSTIEERNKGRGVDWSIYLYQNGRKMLKAEITAFIGILFIIGIGCLIYFLEK
jgi:hypothetical protein